MYSPLLPVALERLLSDGFQLVEVPEEEFYAETQAVTPWRLALGGRGDRRESGDKAADESRRLQVHTYAGQRYRLRGVEVLLALQNRWSAREFTLCNLAMIPRRCRPSPSPAAR